MAWKGNPTNTVPNTLQKDINLSEGRIDENRALHLRRNDTMKNFTVTIKDIDETVQYQLDKMSLLVVDAGNHIKVPIFYSSPEKWKSIQNDGFMRDNNGKIILPAITYSRSSVESDKSLATFNKYLRYSVMKLYSPKNQYTKFSVLTDGNKTAPLHEVYNVVYPDHLNFNYKFIIWTEYIEQMNALIERINFETNDYWGHEKGLRFRTYVDSYANTTEVENGDDRIVKTEFDLVLKGYLLPDLFAPGLDGFKSTTEKRFTAKKIIFATEIVNSDQILKKKSNVDKWRNKEYPNLTEMPSPPEISLARQSYKNYDSVLSIPPTTTIVSDINAIYWNTEPTLWDTDDEFWNF